MNSTMAIIMTDWTSTKLNELAQVRSSAAIPIGGKYRAIDFVLSNIVNSGISKVGVVTQHRFRSLLDHLGSGREWDLDRRNEGIYLFPPFLSEERSCWYKGSADALHANLAFLKRSSEKYVLITQGNSIFKTTFYDMLEFHEQKEADITLIYRDVSNLPLDQRSEQESLVIDDDNRVIEIRATFSEEKPKCSMGMYLLKREFLIYLIEECIAEGNYEFVQDILMKKVETIKIYGYEFKGYWRNLNTIKAYYNCNMEMLDDNIRKELFNDNGLIYTKVKDEPPAKFFDDAEVKNSIVADGCIVEGKIENSVVFRGVKVKNGSIIKNSILMQDAIIGSNVVLENVILDKNVIISDGLQLKGSPVWPVVVGKDTIV